MARQILLIDDDEGYLLAVRRMLEGAGYDVRTARSAAEAREQLTPRPPDLILLDVIMPAEDGFTFAKELAESDAVADVPVVLVTSVADTPGQAMYAFRKGDGLTAADVLAKADVPDQLLPCVSAVLGEDRSAPAMESEA